LPFGGLAALLGFFGLIGSGRQLPRGGGRRHRAVAVRLSAGRRSGWAGGAGAAQGAWFAPRVAPRAEAIARRASTSACAATPFRRVPAASISSTRSFFHCPHFRTAAAIGPFLSAPLSPASGCRSPVDQPATPGI
jgi:hypothetical protein